MKPLTIYYPVGCKTKIQKKKHLLNLKANLLPGSQYMAKRLDDAIKAL